MTAIVWDDRESDEVSRQLSSHWQPTHVSQTMAREETDVEMVIDLSETGPRKNSSIVDQTCEDDDKVDNSTRDV